MDYFSTSTEILRRTVLSGLCLAAVVLGSGVAAWAQDKALPPGDVISARKTLMSVIARNMYPLDEMIYTGKINLPRGRGHADSIAAMMQAFPLLFPAHTNTWKPGTADPASATFADPHIWDQFDFFYKESMVASKYAFDAAPKPKRSSGRASRSCARPATAATRRFKRTTNIVAHQSADQPRTSLGGHSRRFRFVRFRRHRGHEFLRQGRHGP